MTLRSTIVAAMVVGVVAASSSAAAARRLNTGARPVAVRLAQTSPVARHVAPAPKATLSRKTTTALRGAANNGNIKAITRITRQAERTELTPRPGRGRLTTSQLGGSCPADTNGDGKLTEPDIFGFLDNYFVRDLRADMNANGSVTVQDLLDFVTTYLGGCPANPV